MSDETKEETDELREQMIAEMGALMDLMNSGDFDAVIKKMESLDVSQSLDMSLTYLNTVAMCYLKIEEAYVTFYTKVYDAFNTAYGEERTERILSARKPSSMDEEYKTPSPAQEFLTSASDQIFGLNIDREPSQ